ncbi:MAG: MoaD/ThiS family protein [Alcaligenaceae bacterium]|nr:MoaD/ThiS family protein [Alcaligenaceae bacterium]
MIQILYFAQVAEHMGCREETQTLKAAVPAGQWLAGLEARCPALAPAARLKIAINQEYVGGDALIRPGDEVAVFEAVTGG